MTLSTDDSDDTDESDDSNDFYDSDDVVERNVFYGRAHHAADGQSQKDEDDDGHLRNEVCALWRATKRKECAHLLNGNF